MLTDYARDDMAAILIEMTVVSFRPEWACHSDRAERAEESALYDNIKNAPAGKAGAFLLTSFRRINVAQD